MHGLVAALVLASTAAPAGDNAALIGKTRRWAAVLEGLPTSGSVPVTLAELSHAVPDAVVLSRVTYDRSRARWTIELSKGSKIDALAALDRLAAAGLCAHPSVTDLKGVSASCDATLKAQTTKVGPESSYALNGRDEYGSELQRRLGALREAVPAVVTGIDVVGGLEDTLRLDELDLASIDRLTTTTSGPVDEIGFLVRGSAPFPVLWSAVQRLTAGRRRAVIEGLDLTAPRLRRGDWVVDFVLRVGVWRYRVEEEATEQALSSAKEDRLTPELANRIPDRNPFGPLGETFAGSLRALKGDECRQPQDVAAFDGDDLDALSVVYLGPASRCAMVIDDRGVCHELQLSTKVGAQRVTRIDPSAITFGSFLTAPSGFPIKREVGLKSAPAGTKPPPWFCRM
ncbi:MAG: hypothetical protein QM723_06280 [Myxococcaceae bacterium]